jgi:thioredoxin 1
MKAKWTTVVFLAIAAAAVLVLSGSGSSQAGPENRSPAGVSGNQPVAAQAAGSPLSGRVTMIDLGATRCVPCKMMAPIIEELKKEYAGRADIIFYDVWKDPAPAKKYGIRAIPTQIFFDSGGREVYRHTGFMGKQSIVAILVKLGVS